MNYNLRDVKTKLMDIQKSRKESILFGYLQQLFIKKGYSDVQITHGPNEYGKDLVFNEFNSKLNTTDYYAVVVKNKDSGMTDFERGGEIMRQIDLSFQYPYSDNKGIKYQISKVIVIINGSVSNQAINVIQQTIDPSKFANIYIWNYQKLSEELYGNIVNIFLAENLPDIDTFLEYQSKQFLEFNSTNDIYHGLSINDINDIYVNVRTNYRVYEQKKSTYTNYEGNSTAHLKDEIDESLTIVHSNFSFVISGIATSGKTLMLKRVGYNSVNHYQQKRIAPFYIQLGKIKTCEDFDFGNEIESIYKKITGIEFDYQKYSKICLLLDGIDEISSEEARRILLTRISEFYDSFSNNHKGTILQIVLSTRDLSFIEKGTFLKKYEKMELLPFDIGQAFKLVKKLIPEDKVKAEKFVQAVKNTQLTNSLTRTPMALSLMAILYKEDEIELDELPANITELYNKFTDYYLNKWDTSKGISLQYKFEESKQILGFIANEIHENNDTIITLSELKDFLAKLKDNFDFEDLEDIDGFLKALKERTGIINYDNEQATFSFSHLAFQEYFVSISYDDSSEEDLITKFYDEWWSNTIVFYCGKQPKRDVFLKKVMDKITPSDIYQSFTHITLLSRALQAGYLMNNNSKRQFVTNIIYEFNKVYNEIISTEKKQQYGITYLLSTVDVILRFRDFIFTQLRSRHLNQKQVVDVIDDILSNHQDSFSDVPLYCIAYYASVFTKDTKYLEAFIANPKHNTRWDRIVYIDIEKLNNGKVHDEKTYKKIKRNQIKNKLYIQLQLKQSAYRHLGKLL
ncbi:NACHT domain-containing protein [Sphingobacterium spiritivorum]|uniref:NACHT domain-containing protein n=1 Tax=Sphingobacterium spiritivorum TaxID=258 RepID=UPI003DA66BD7